MDFDHELKLKLKSWACRPAIPPRFRADVWQRIGEPQGEMEWLRREFQLTDAQFARIKQLHDDYRPRCDLMCERIAEANTKLNQLIESNNAVTPEVEAALKESAAQQEYCRRQMLG